MIKTSVERDRTLLLQEQDTHGVVITLIAVMASEASGNIRCYVNI